MHGRRGESGDDRLTGNPNTRNAMNALIRRLESGKGTIRGMRMLYPLHHSALFEIKVRGFNVSDGGTVKIEAEPLNGAGSFTADANDFIDDSKASRDLYFRRQKANDFRMNSDYRGATVATKRAVIANTIPTLTKAQQKLVEEWLAPRGAKVATLHQYDLGQLWQFITDLKFDLTNGEA
jgi:uncharacterized protein YggL (DUF469 family)